MRYENNPFLDSTHIKIKGKPIRFLGIEEGDNVVINRKTGEVTATEITAYKKTDSNKFIKIFTENIAALLDLTGAGIKALTVVMVSMQKGDKNKDRIQLDLETLRNFLKDNPGKEIPLSSYKRGIGELEKAGIVAKTMRRGEYFINPSFAFYGNRLTFLSIVDRGQNLNEPKGGEGNEG